MESESQQSEKKAVMVEASFSEENEVELINTSVSDLSKESKEYDMRSDSFLDLQQIIDDNDRDKCVNESTLSTFSTLNSSSQESTEKELPEDNNISSAFLKEISCLREELSQVKKELKLQRSLRKKKERYLVKLAKQLSRRIEEIKEKDKKYDKVKKEKAEFSAKFLSLEAENVVSEKSLQDSKNNEAALVAEVSSLKAQLALKDDKYNEISEKISILNKSHEKSCEEFQYQLSETNQESEQLRTHLAKVDIITIKLTELVNIKKENYIESIAALIDDISSLKTQLSNTKEEAEKYEQAEECQLSKSNQETEEMSLKLDEVNTSVTCSELMQTRKEVQSTDDTIVDTKEKQNTKNIEEIMKVNLRMVKKCEEFHKQLLESNQESERLRSHVMTNDNSRNTSTSKNAIQRISIFIAIIVSFTFIFCK